MLDGEDFMALIMVAIVAIAVTIYFGVGAKEQLELKNESHVKASDNYNEVLGLNQNKDGIIEINMLIEDKIETVRVSRSNLEILDGDKDGIIRAKVSRDGTVKLKIGNTGTGKLEVIENTESKTYELKD